MSVFYLILAGIFETMWPFGFKLAHGSAYRDWWIAGSLLAVALSIIFFIYRKKICRCWWRILSGRRLAQSALLRSGLCIFMIWQHGQAGSEFACWLPE